MNQNRPYQDLQQSLYDQVNNWQDWSSNGRQQLERALRTQHASYAQKNNIEMNSLPFNQGVTNEQGFYPYKRVGDLYLPTIGDIATGTWNKKDILGKIMPVTAGWGENEWLAHLQAEAAKVNPLQGMAGSRGVPTNNSISYNANPYGMNIASMYNIPSAYGQGPWSNSMWG
jgi:hypothetical protein